MESPTLRQITPEEAWKIACHEAGHAVVAVRLWFPFTRVSIDGNEYGEVDVVGSPIDNEHREWTSVEISLWQQFYAAGDAAEQLLFGCRRAGASRIDQRCHGELEREPVRRDGWEFDVQSVMQLFDPASVKRVAKELQQRMTLNYEDVCKLIGCKTSWED